MSKFVADSLICPRCHGLLSDGKYTLDCHSCKLVFPVYAGVPDFRNSNKNFRTSQQELKTIDLLMSAYESSSFRELIEIRYNASNGIPNSLFEHQKAFELSYEQKGTYRLFQIEKLMEARGMNFSGGDFFLDIGCGSGTAVPWIMKNFKGGVGIDYSIVDLIVGQKFLYENGIMNLKLVCADARSLPLPDGVIDFVNATDVIEHILPGQEQFVSEVKRVLKSGSGFYFNSPNRYNIFTREPHVKVRFVGFIPRSFMNSYVKMMKGVNYSSIRLLSLSELKLIIHGTFGNDFILSGPFIDLKAPALDLKRKVVKRFPFLLDIINKLFLFFVTNYQVIAFKTPK